jgi:tetratricopeptide (TPR) repeat protein
MIVCKKLKKTTVDASLLEKALKALDTKPNHFLTLFNISLIYLEQHKYAEAHKYLERAYE